MKAYTLLIQNPFDIKKYLTWVSTLQRKVIGTKYNHGAILIYDDENYFGKGIGWFVIESVAHGVHIITLATYISYSTDRITDIIPCELLGYKPDYKFLKEQIGKSYQYSIWWSYLLLITSNTLFGEKSKLSYKLTNVNNPDRWYCFELIDSFFDLKLGHTEVGKTFELEFNKDIYNTNLVDLEQTGILKYS